MVPFNSARLALSNNIVFGRSIPNYTENYFFQKIYVLSRQALLIIRPHCHNRPMQQEPRHYHHILKGLLELPDSVGGQNGQEENSQIENF